MIMKENQIWDPINMKTILARGGVFYKFELKILADN